MMILNHVCHHQFGVSLGLLAGALLTMQFDNACRSDTCNTALIVQQSLLALIVFSFYDWLCTENSLKPSL